MERVKKNGLSSLAGLAFTLLQQFKQLLPVNGFQNNTWPLCCYHCSLPGGKLRKIRVINDITAPTILSAYTRPRTMHVPLCNPVRLFSCAAKPQTSLLPQFECACGAWMHSLLHSRQDELSGCAPQSGEHWNSGSNINGNINAINNSNNKKSNQEDSVKVIIAVATIESGNGISFRCYDVTRVAVQFF